MTNAEYRRRLHKLTFTCAMNHRYHHAMEYRCGVVDKVIRGIVAMLAIIGLVLSVPGADSPPWGLTVGILSMVVAAVLNIVPVGDWEKNHGELYRLWSDLRSDAEIEEHKTCAIDGEKDAPKNCVERLMDLTSKANALHLSEPVPRKSLLDKCYEDEIEAEFGNGIRTFAAAEEFRQQRLKQWTAIDGSAVDSAATDRESGSPVDIPAAQ